MTMLTAPAPVRTGQLPGRVTAVTVRVPVHTMRAVGDVVEVPVIVHHIDPDTTEVLIEGKVVGYIRYDGHHFAAFTGAPLDEASLRGHADLWDQALARLYAADPA